MNETRIFGYSNYAIPYLDLSQYQVEKEVVSFIPKSIAQKYIAVPIEKMGNILTVAICNPTLEIIKELEKITKCIVRVVKSEKGHIENLINQKRRIENEEVYTFNNRN